MQHVLLCLGVFMLFSSCYKQNATSSVVLNERVDTMQTMSSSFLSGTFSNGPWGVVTGKAVIYKNGESYILALEGFNTSNGPDLYVYLSKEEQPVNFIALGELKSTSGNQVYTVPGMPDFSSYKYALIHCQAFNHLFGKAVLR